MKRVIIASLLSAMIITTPTFAVSQKFLDFMAKNNIFYFLPGDFFDNCYPATESYDGIPSAGLSDLQSAFVDKYHSVAESLGNEYGIPWEAVVAQGILESASGTSHFAMDRNNFFGIGAVDSNPSAAYHYGSVAEGWRGYFDFIAKNPRYRNAGAFNHAGDPIGYIQAVKSAGYATDPNYVAKLTPLIKAIQNRAAEKNWSFSSSSVGMSGGSSYDLCLPTAGGNGDLNATALALSWDDRSHGLTPNDAYRNALAAVGLSGFAADSFVRMGASCDAFVATVLRYSGVDPNVPCCGAAKMLNYFASHPEKYVEIPNVGNASNMQPGDIRVSPSHVEMYVTGGDGVGRIASASHGDRTADHARGYYVNGNMRIFRAR